MLLPCNMDNKLLGGSADGIPKDCNWDKDKLIDYLGPLNMVIYKNSAGFSLDE